jgi:hypothetical protein
VVITIPAPEGLRDPREAEAAAPRPTPVSAI